MATSDATTRIDVGPIHRAEVRELEQRFGVVAWFGFHTRRWWALVGDRLVEAATPAGLADAVMAVRGATTPPAALANESNTAWSASAGPPAGPVAAPERWDTPQGITNEEGGTRWAATLRTKR
ncbi:hypothetical protein GCM10009735_25800 [Actinomadura chokoriensis]